MCHHKHNEWFEKVEVGIHTPPPSAHPGFWVTGCEKLSSPWSLHFTPRLCVYGLIQPFHISLTLPISHYKYIEWSGMVEIGIWALKWSPQPIFELLEGTNLAWPVPTFHTQIECLQTDSGNSQNLNPPNLSLLVCWMVKQDWDWNSPSTTITTPCLLSQGWWKFRLQFPAYHTKIDSDSVQTDSVISQHFNPSYLSS